MAISSARQFFDQAVAGGAAFLEKLVTDRTHETEWLDFKGGDDIGDGQVKSLWTKAICGFGNNQGGCIVWGIDARRDPATDVDAANAVKYVTDAAALRSRLAQLHPGATEPPLLGVESVAVFAIGTSGPGFVVSHIPESDSKPHRCELLENKPYMLRVGDSFKIPSPSILRNLFYPRSSPSLQINVECQWKEPSGSVPPNEMEVWYRIHLKNTGLVSAKDMYVIAKGLPHNLTLECPYGTTESDTDLGRGIEIKRPLQPHISFPIGVFRQKVGVSHGGHGFRPRIAGRVFSAYFQVFAEDMVPLKQQVEFGDRDVHERKTKPAGAVQDFDPEFYSEEFRTEN